MATLSTDVLLPSTARGRWGLLFQVLGLFCVFFTFGHAQGLDNRLFQAALAVLLVWLIPFWTVRAILVATRRSRSGSRGTRDQSAA